MTVVIVLFYVMGILSVISAVMSTRTSQGAIAWVVSLITFPFIAVPAYWVFGHSRFKGYVKARYSSDKKINEALTSIHKSLEPYMLEPVASPLLAHTVVEKLADIPFLSQNSVELLIDGEEVFESILEGIAAAKTYIFFQFYIVHDDVIGKEIKTQLIAKAKEGVSVHFLYDEIGSHGLSESYKRDLKKHGIEVSSFNTQKGRGNRFQLNFRNHRKVVVVDGVSAWVGGLNVGDEYLGRDPKFGNWRDTHMKITGPSALAVQASFVEDWFWATEKTLPKITWTPVPAESGDAHVLIVPSGPADSMETASLMFLDAINVATERIWLATPYFVPDTEILSALHLASLRGVDIRIVIPDKTDNMLVNLSFYTYLEDTKNSNIRFFRYTDGFLHEKVMLIDNDAAIVGTANFDNRSFRLNFEISSIVVDEVFVKEVETMFVADFARSREMTKEEREKQSFWFKLVTRLARLTSPIQ